MSTPRRVPAIVIHLATLLLPTGAARDRYRRELLAELYDLTESRQLRYALGVAGHILALRRAVTAVSSPRSTPWHCRLHLWHHYRTASTEDGQLYRNCTDCGADKTGDIDPEGSSISSRGLPMPF